MRELLDALGVDTRDPTFATTPRTTARAYAEILLAGMREDPLAALGRGFPVGARGRGVVVAAHLPLLFVCPHHLMPARGEAHVAFLPNERVPGLSRIGRLVDALSRRLVLQEELAGDITEALVRGLSVRAAAVVLEAEHTCVAIEDHARREARFFTRSSVGPAELVARLDRDLDLAVRAPKGSRPRGGRSRRPTAGQR